MLITHSRIHECTLFWDWVWHTRTHSLNPKCSNWNRTFMNRAAYKKQSCVPTLNVRTYELFFFWRTKQFRVGHWRNRTRAITLIWRRTPMCQRAPTPMRQLMCQRVSHRIRQLMCQHIPNPMPKFIVCAQCTHPIRVEMVRTEPTQHTHARNAFWKKVYTPKTNCIVYTTVIYTPVCTSVCVVI